MFYGEEGTEPSCGVSVREKTMTAQYQSNSKELAWVHWLRAAAAFAVVVIHVCSKDFTVPLPSSAVWQTLNAYESMVHWAVPVFVMISGALLLDPVRELPLKKLFGKYFLRIFAVLVFWSLFYAVLYTGVYLRGSLRQILFAAWEGYPHLWYLYMLLGLYLVTPLLRPLACSARAMRYFVILAGVFSVLLPTLGLFDLAPFLRFFASRLDVSLVLGYAGYFVLGRLLSCSLPGKRLRVCLYVLALGGTAAAVLIDGLGSAARGEIFIPLMDSFSPCTALQAAALFVFFRAAAGEGAAPRWVKDLSGLSFGIYLIHQIPVDFLRRFCGLSTLTLHPLVSVPLIALLSYALSALAASVLKRIPLLRKTIE